MLLILSFIYWGWHQLTRTHCRGDIASTKRGCSAQHSDGRKEWGNCAGDCGIFTCYEIPCKASDGCTQERIDELKAEFLASLAAGTPTRAGAGMQCGSNAECLSGKCKAYCCDETVDASQCTECGLAGDCSVNATTTTVRQIIVSCCVLLHSFCCLRTFSCRSYGAALFHALPPSPWDGRSFV